MAIVYVHNDIFIHQHSVVIPANGTPLNDHSIYMQYHMHTMTTQEGRWLTNILLKQCLLHGVCTWQLT